MGHNLISCCHKCKVQLYSFRHEEDVAMLDFYIKHAECAKKDINNVQTVMDNNSTDQKWAEAERIGGYEEDSLQP